MLFIIASFIASASVVYSSFLFFYYERKLTELDKIKYDLKRYFHYNMDKLYEICNDLEKLLLKNHYNNDATLIISIRSKIDNFYDNV
jgi:hypothetical protein